MNSAASHFRSHDDIERESALWVIRRDRGLTPAEQDELSQWLAADPRHGGILAEHRWGWEELDRLTGLQSSQGARPDPDLFAPRPGSRSMAWRRLRWLVPVTLAAAAAIILVLRPQGTVERAVDVALSAAVAAPDERRVLEDGSVVDLNGDSEIDVAFTERERRIRLVRGQANFTVARDPARPFVVSAAGVNVRAVGTVFTVRLDSLSVEVMVTEGRVRIESRADAGLSAESLLVSAGNRAMVSHAAGLPAQIAKLIPAQLSGRPAGQSQTLTFNDARLAEVVAAFNRHNRAQLVLGEPALGQLRVGGSFKANDVEGFLRLLQAALAIEVESRSEREIVLKRG